VGADYYNDEPTEVILPVPPPGRRSAAGGRGSGGSGGARSAGSSAGSGHGAGGRSGSSGGKASGKGGSKSGGSRSTATGSRSGGSQGRQGGRGKQAGRSTPGNRRPAARGKAASRARGKSGRQAAPPPSRNLLITLTAWLFRGVAMLWMLVAGVVGSIVRRFGRNARDLHDDHKRDGIGLLFLGLAIIFVAAVWFRMRNPAFEGIYTLTSSVAGEGAFTIPILFGLVGWRFMRHPDRNTALPPAEIGWTALLAGALGLLHVAKGVPTLARPHGSWAAVRAAGGLIGLATSWPLDKGLTAWVATPLLGLLAAYGLLVVTGTPVRQVPSRLAEFKAMFGYAPYDDWDDLPAAGDDEYDPDELDGSQGRGEIRRGVIRLKGALEPGDQRKPYDPQVLVTGERRAGRGAAGGGSRAPKPEARIGEGLLEDLGFTTETDGPPPAAHGPGHASAAGRAADAERGGGGQLHAAPVGAAAPGQPAQGPH
jgi:S-DNA-T family DNA segregation ATPase FtsK/SpoIIIE